jgi:hypothetical protein
MAWFLFVWVVKRCTRVVDFHCIDAPNVPVSPLFAYTYVKSVVSVSENFERDN